MPTQKEKLEKFLDEMSKRRKGEKGFHMDTYARFDFAEELALQLEMGYAEDPLELLEGTEKACVNCWEELYHDARRELETLLGE